MIHEAINLLRQGRIIFIHDSEDRENEVDAVIRADAVNTATITWLRKYAGGLICFVTDEAIGRQLGLGFMSELLRNAGFNGLVKRPGYGDDPAFSIYVNHVNTKTGIRDNDKALTISRLADVVKVAVGGEVSRARDLFYREFYAPGHVPILLGRVGRRFGHTELSLILAKMANIPPALVITEVLSDDGSAASVDYVREVASRMGSVVVAGHDIINHARELSII
ncbi:3,4-dihydroxy-2-butanone-4-phosphate synthase [Vulcanisaeta thermophila]|uniref:3,4-dihydroxy-2-butanone-4-phosphate synthase n=1 Tax=Vulcanisaeta thermophila TaxID=867917 RepID=UPI000852AEC9|nr:3,4-dihydroxy-2-butanone-4-phosphate synthase [Vulcanisaeta thermophila]